MESAYAIFLFTKYHNILYFTHSLYNCASSNFPYMHKNPQSNNWFHDEWTWTKKVINWCTHLMQCARNWNVSEIVKSPESGETNKSQV